MNAKLLSIAATAAALSLCATACDDDDNDDKGGTVSVASIDATASNVGSFATYMKLVAKYLVDDATTLCDAWESASGDYPSGYATYFKSLPALEAAEQIVDGCSDIANEVGEAKIGEPIDKWSAGNKTQAVLAVESWYSWHSRDDYRNNIASIRNSYFGTTDGTVGDKSLSAAVKKANAELDANVVAAIEKAADAIYAIPQPFRNNIASSEALAAKTACGELYDILRGNLKKALESIDAQELKEVVANYVDVVVLPTYANLKAKNTALKAAVDAFAASPSDKGFEACAAAWLAARQPWETSEAFLFGPVADKGLDPNMDSWPLDQNGIENILTSGRWDNLDWSGDFDEESESIAAAQSLRGYHTLEFLTFKDGNPRTIVK